MIEFEISTNKKQIEFDITQGIPKYVPANFQTKNITITENGTTEVVADSGYDGLAKVSVEANVQDKSLLNVIKGLNSMGVGDPTYPLELTADMFDENSTTIYQYRYYRNNNLTKVEIPNSLTSIGSYAFRDCSRLAKVDFRSATQVPTIQSNSFYSVPTTCKFIIPDSLYDSWIASTNWVSLYNNGYQFVKAGEYTEA